MKNKLSEGEYFYIISSPELLRNSSFKIGITETSDIRILQSRYNTYVDGFILAFINLNGKDRTSIEKLLKLSLLKGRKIHTKTVTEIIRIRYNALVLTLKAIVDLGIQIVIHPDYFILPDDDILPQDRDNHYDYRFHSIPEEFASKRVTGPILLRNFEPNINNYFELLVDPAKVSYVDFNRLFPHNNVDDIIDYFRFYRDRFINGNCELYDPDLIFDHQMDRSDDQVDISPDQNVRVDSTASTNFEPKELNKKITKLPIITSDQGYFLLQNNPQVLIQKKEIKSKLSIPQGSIGILPQKDSNPKLTIPLGSIGIVSHEPKEYK